MRFAWILSFVVGFLSLSQEILWVRIMSFAHGGTPMAFSLVLTLYLVGIAAGAAVGKRLCEGSRDLYAVVSVTLLLAALTDPLPSLLGPYIANRGQGLGLTMLVIPVIAITGTAAIKSVLFPIAHHLGSNQQGPHVGSSVSRVYFGNILGSTMGPLVTGYVLLDHFTVDQCCMLIAAGSLLMALVCAMRSARRPLWYATMAVPIAASWLLVAAHSDYVLSAGRTTLYGAGGIQGEGEITHKIENKHGVIHTVGMPGAGGVVIYGGNMYDGHFSIDLGHDSNGIGRVYLISALHPRMARVLVIGMSGGAWTRALAGFAGVDTIDAVEINPGYISLMRNYPDVAPVLDDPRLSVHIDDGRRWLRRHPEARFDLIVMNTTIHYRAYSTNLLSREFLLEVKHHLNPGGLIGLNTTGSLDAVKTALDVFPQVVHHGDFLYAGLEPFVPGRELAHERIAQLSRDGRLMFDDGAFADGGHGARLVDMATNLKPAADLLQSYSVSVITDANMLPEYRYGQRLEIPPFNWLLPPRRVQKH